MVTFGQGEGTLRGLEDEPEGLSDKEQKDSSGSFHDKGWEHLMTHQGEHLGIIQFLYSLYCNKNV